MFVTSNSERAGIMVAVISGGRPKLSQRPTHKLLGDLKKAGFKNICWVVAEHHAAEYEKDGNEIVSYSSQWSHEYAKKHWMSTDPVPPIGGFHGAFTGREAACLEAERRGCWAVIQLDDNIIKLGAVKGTVSARKVVENNGGLALHADLLAAMALSTNGRMVGVTLQAIPEAENTVVRPGFVYSLFLEKVGEGREHWYGPFEDDITHAYQYGTRADGATSLMLPMLNYRKESKSTSGMRKHYNHKRAVQLQRIFPESAKISIQKAKANGRGGARVFHKMSSSAIRNPLAITDKNRYNKIVRKLNAIIEEWAEIDHIETRKKIQGRINKAREKEHDNQKKLV